MARNNKTVINSAFANQVTSINSNIKNETVINRNAQVEKNAFTEVNPIAQNYSIDVPTGTVLGGKYKILSPMQVNSGEANLYLCECSGKQYVAKIYRRQSAVKETIVSALSSIDSPYVARTYATGVWNNAPFEILPYYKYGSLEGKTFSFEQLGSTIIPALNEGLHTLHSKGIIHKDLKPSNIMLCNDQKNVAIIDFGISSVREGGNTVVVTKTGMTPEYSAPETFRNLFLEESDYYSLGITLYELFCGHTPYAGTDKDMIEQYIAIQKLPFPADFPNELRDLITALTYNDITNRKDKSNPNRRWTYEEVKDWCAGEKMAIPGGISSANQQLSVSAEEDTIPSITFQYNKYKSRFELARALGADWENGKKRLYRSALTSYFEKFDTETMVYCMDAEEAANRDASRRDIEYFKVLYHICPYMDAIYWKDQQYDSMLSFGEDLLSRLQDAKAIPDRMKEMVSNHLLSAWEEIVSHENPKISQYVHDIENRYILAQQTKDKLVELEQLYLIAYYFSKSNALKTALATFTTLDDLIGYSKHALNDTSKTFDKLAQDLIINTGGDGKTLNPQSTYRPTPQFYAWLTAMGKSDVLEKLGFARKEAVKK